MEEAKSYGDLLVVTLTAEKFVNKGPGRPYFNDKLRARSLAALECVDYVVVIPHPAAVEAIECVRPQVYCKGREYADQGNDVTGNIREDVAAVQKVGGEVHYLGSVVFSSSKLINHHFDQIPAEVKQICQELAKNHPPDRIKCAVESLAELRVLVIGDIIFDRYSFLRVQGLTSKNRILSGRYLYEETQPGGALAVFNHIKQFTPHVRLASLMGTEPWSLDLLRQSVSPVQDLVLKDDEFTTIIKQRFVESAGGGQGTGQTFFCELHRRGGSWAAGAGEADRECAERLWRSGRGGGGRLWPWCDGRFGARMRAEQGAVFGAELPDEQQQPRL